MASVKFFRELALCHAGARICVTGGGPYLQQEAERVKADVWISANEHGAKLRPVDYIIASDDKHTGTGRPMLKHLREFSDAPIIGPWPWCDYVLTDWPLAPRHLLSGALGAWAAWAMGGHPIILAGMDCYGGSHQSVEQFLWMREHMQGAQVRVSGGPLVGQVWPALAAREKVDGKHDADAITRSFATRSDEVRVRVKKATTLRGIEWPAGSELPLFRHEATRLLKHGVLLEV